MGERLTFRPEIFEVASREQARAIILTQESPEETSARRWEKETPYLTAMAAERLALGPQDVLLDYGCGIGRLAGALIARTGCRVLGVDSSAGMRALAASELRVPGFAVVAPEMLDALVAAGLRCTAAIAVWVLQHCFDPARDIARLHAALAPAAPLLLVNNNARAVPTAERGWVHDGKQVRPLLEACFDETAAGQLDAAQVGPRVAGFAFWATYRRRGGAD